MGLSGKQLLPGNSMRLSDLNEDCVVYTSDEWISSANMQPIDQTSMAWQYLFYVKIISGALYHLETTELDSSRGRPESCWFIWPILRVSFALNELKVDW